MVDQVEKDKTSLGAALDSILFVRALRVAGMLLVGIAPIIGNRIINTYDKMDDMLARFELVIQPKLDSLSVSLDKVQKDQSDLRIDVTVLKTTQHDTQRNLNQLSDAVYRK